MPGMAEEADPPWSIDDVAGTWWRSWSGATRTSSPARVTDIDEITDNWERIKTGRRRSRGTVDALDGIALSQPALALATKIVQRAARAGQACCRPAAPWPATEAELGRALFAAGALAAAAAGPRRGGARCGGRALTPGRRWPTYGLTRAVSAGIG